MIKFLKVKEIYFKKYYFFYKKYPINQYDDDFYKFLTETLIIASPLIPHFTSECWSKIRNKKILEKHFDWVKDIV